ncbi:MAG: HAD hydrolase-like protein, partial [Eubacterium sp.]|nr:HAD hydrolase-like protein [Eubacterium sp.]
MLYLFDFDGTVCDTAPGVLGCTKEALVSMGYKVPDEQTLRLFLGPPINWAMRELAHVK